MQEKSRSGIREQLWSDSRSLSKPYNSESQNLVALRFWIGAWYTKWYGCYRKRFYNDHLLTKDYILHDIQQFKEFGIILSGIETWYYRNYKETREWNEQKIIKYIDSFTPLPK